MDISVLLIAVIIALVLVLWFVLHGYNRLGVMRNDVGRAWSDIDVQFRFRHNLVPNLVESVKGYMSQERETLEAVAQSRSAAIKAGADVVSRTLAEMALSGAVGNWLVAGERYPELKAAQNFLLLQEQLTTIENRTLLPANTTTMVRRYNPSIAEFPRNLLAGALRYCPEKMVVAESKPETGIFEPRCVAGTGKLGRSHPSKDMIS
jgi:LemA protein